MASANRKRSRVAARWGVGVAAAVLVHAAGLFFLRVDPMEEEISEADYSFASLPWMGEEEAQGDLLREQAYLFDSAPLFLPTRWNAVSSPVVRALEQRPPELFNSFPAHLSSSEDEHGLGEMETDDPVSPAISLEAFGRAMPMPFGRNPVDLPNLERRAALIEVRKPGEEELILAEWIPVEDAPERAGELWAPSEFLIHVENVGVVGEPVLLSGSGVEEVDLFLREEIRQLLRDRMLEVGYFRVVAGP